MAQVTEKVKLTWDEFMFGMLMLERTTFIMSFWSDDMIIPKSRKDLPKEYTEHRFVITKEILLLWQDYSQFRLVCTSRKIGKTLFLEALNIQECITYTGEPLVEAMFFAPGEHQIKPVLNRLQSKVMREPVFSAMLKSWNAGDGIVNWENNVVLHLRIEGMRGGQNMIGLRARLFMAGDEMAYGSDAAHAERQNTSTPECPIIYCGVPNGVRGTPFFLLDQTPLGSSYRHHKYMITANPLYHSDKAIRGELKKHGDDIHSQSWVTQVLGEWGSEAQSSFPVVPVLQKYNFRSFSFSSKELDTPQRIADLVRIPDIDALRWVIAADIGYSPSPTEIGLWAEVEEGVWYQATRISMLRIDMPDQAAIIDSINLLVLPRPASVIAIDAHGQGSGVLQSLHSDLMASRYGWYDYKRLAFDVGFAGNVEQREMYVHKKCNTMVRKMDEVWFCDTCRQAIWSVEELKHPKIQAKQAYTISLKSMLDAGGAWLSREKER